jgi:hypothetical protein
MHLDSEEASLSPISSPTVSSYPILNTVFFSPSNDCDFVVDLRNQLGFRKDTSGISLKFEGSIYSA